MRKYSRRNGWMVLQESENVDGSVSLSWTAEDEPGRKVLEPVTESDASEHLRIPENEVGRAGWVIVVLGELVVRLARMVSRPANTSSRLLMDGREYEYDQAVDGRTSLGMWSVAFRFGGVEVRDPSVLASLCFFLRHESEFRASGLGTREKR